MRRVAQVSEYRPIARLRVTSMSEDGMTLILPCDYPQRLVSLRPKLIASSVHKSTLSPPQKNGLNFLAGSKLGHPSFSPLQTRTRFRSVQSSFSQTSSFLPQHLHSSEPLHTVSRCALHDSSSGMPRVRDQRLCSRRSSSTSAQYCQSTFKPCSPSIKINFYYAVKQEDLTVYGGAGDVPTKFSSFTTSNKHDEMPFQPPCGTGDVLYAVTE
jgi:hypothetical protein